jgi:protease-4
MNAPENNNDLKGEGDRRMGGSAQNQLIIEHLNEANNIRKRELRWKNVRFWAISVMVAMGIGSYVLVGALLYTNTGVMKPTGDYVSLVRIHGPIDAEQRASAANLNPALVRAFKDNKSKGVVIVINSPGGSPVQSSLIHDRIVKLRQQYPEKKVVVVGEDLMTSAAYLIATASPEIYVNRSTLTGSVGVIMSGFGFDGLIRKFDVQRRVYTAGKHKNRLDPFQPTAPEDVRKIQETLAQVHQHFIDSVLLTRKGKLKGKPEDLFTGDFWAGDRAVQLGLADGISDLTTVMKMVFNVEAAMDYTPQPNFFDKLAGRLPGMIVNLLNNQSAPRPEAAIY